MMPRFLFSIAKEAISVTIHCQGVGMNHAVLTVYTVRGSSRKITFNNDIMVFENLSGLNSNYYYCCIKTRKPAGKKNSEMSHFIVDTD